MNPAATSREAILQECRQLLIHQGAAAINMRAVAQACGVALGSLYNYFPSKAALIRATVQSIWEDIFHLPDAPPQLHSFPAAVRWLYDRLAEGALRYPGFFTLHAISFAQGEKPAARQQMADYFGHIRRCLITALAQDPALVPGSLHGALSPEALVTLCMDSVLAMHMSGRDDIEALLRLLSLALYPR